MIPLRFGYKASAEQFGPTELLDYAVLAEEVGFDSVFISDHLQPWLHEGVTPRHPSPGSALSAPAPRRC
nr:hypothetical protein GCM10025699_11730 [Microbacterium flavescens]